MDMVEIIVYADIKIIILYFIFKSLDYSLFNLMCFGA